MQTDFWCKNFYWKTMFYPLKLDDSSQGLKKNPSEWNNIPGETMKFSSSSSAVWWTVTHGTTPLCSPFPRADPCPLHTLPPTTSIARAEEVKHSMCVCQVKGDKWALAVPVWCLCSLTGYLSSNISPLASPCHSPPVQGTPLNSPTNKSPSVELPDPDLPQADGPPPHSPHKALTHSQSAPSPSTTHWVPPPLCSR